MPAGRPVAEVEGDDWGEHRCGATNVLGKEPRGLTEEVAQRWGGGETSAHCRSVVEEVQTVASIASRQACGSTWGRERYGPGPNEEIMRRECGGGSDLGEGTTSVALPNSW
jgi:hypothetical protein